MMFDQLPWPVAVILAALLLLLIALFVAMPLACAVMHGVGDGVRWCSRNNASLLQQRFARWLHLLIAIADGVNAVAGRVVAWCVLLMALTQFVVVIMRYVFAIGSIPLQETIWYLHGIVFMLAAGYTLCKDGHVRVDILYRRLSARGQAWINLLGTVLLLLPVMAITWWFSWSYVRNAWAVMETSSEAAGLPLIYLLKSVILLFVVLLVLQGMAIMATSLLTLTDRQQET